ncbi:MAG: hypothetical protein C4527_08170 [Candidatus Omnitrophota bacterium]|nr:MAG: hypothetical protein C4527_08170 [Candidatus Omnitrophota bacterium]
MFTRTLSVILFCLFSTLAYSQSQNAMITVDFNQRLGPLEIDRFALGQGGLSEEPMWENRVAEIRALRPRLIRLFIQEYFDLLPARGRYHFDTLDRSVDLILATGATPLMCIVFKPRVLFPVVDQDIVEPNDFGEWETLIFNLVKHYKERNAGIRYWEIINEPDIGESGGCPYRFRPENYPRFYQRTVNAVLRADPDALVGGPALANSNSLILPALLDYCEQQKTPLHFVSWHIYSSDPLHIRSTIDNMKTLLKNYPSLKPETILNEWNMSLGNPSNDPRFQPCFIAETAWQMFDAGLDYSCYYHIRDYHVSFERFAQFMSPGGTAFMAKWWNRAPQYDGLFDFQNTMRPSYFVFKLLSRLTGERLALVSDHSTIHGFAAYDETYQLYNLLVWNFSNTAAHVDLACNNLPSDMIAVPIVLDAMTASNDENIRLRRERVMEIKREHATIRGLFEPYGVKFWSME